MTKHATIAQKIQVNILADAGHSNNHIAKKTSLSYRQVSREKKDE
jgi:molybdate-binding protein